MFKPRHRLYHVCLCFGLFCLLHGTVNRLYAQYDERGVPLRKRESVIDSLQKLRAAMPRNTAEDARLLNVLSDAYRYHSTDSALAFAEEAFAIARSVGDVREKAWALYHQSYALYSQGKYDLALEKLSDVAPIFEQIKDTSGTAYTMNELGNIYKRQHRYTEALEYYSKALAGFRAVLNKEGTVLILANMGATERMAGRHVAGFQHSTEALALGESIGYTYGIVFACTNIGSYYTFHTEYDSALSFYMRGLRLAEELRNEKYLSQLRYQIGLVNAYQGNFADAERNIAEGLRIAERAKFAERVKEALAAFVEMYRLQGKYKEALAYQERSTMLQDSLFSADVRKNMDAVHMRLVTERKDKEIQLLQKEQELSTLQRNALLAGLCVIVVILWLVINRYHIKRTALKEVRESHDKILQANAALGTANAQLSEANAEITRQMGLLEEQARTIQITNTELQEMNLRQEIQNTQLKELNEEKNEFMGIAAHDLKNPLSGIQNIAEILLMDDELPITIRREMLTHVTKSSERMFELIKNLLDVNAIERGGFMPSAKPVNIAQIAVLTTDHYQSRANSKNITLTFSGETQAFALADHAAVEQVLDNLISNAVKYSPQEKQVFVRLLEVSSKVRLEVQDEGPGLSETDKRKLFGKFARLSAQPTGGEHSTGLGLSIVKKMVEAMQGNVWCESVLGQGATFIIELPKADMPLEAQTAQS